MKILMPGLSSLGYLAFDLVGTWNLPVPSFPSGLLKLAATVALGLAVTVDLAAETELSTDDDH